MSSRAVSRNKPRYNVGIVGGGIAGLYSALLLQREGHKVRIFEGTDRIGGRVRTHYFTPEQNQYYEAGAMRIPKSEFHEIVFELFKFLDSKSLPEDKKVDRIPYILNHAANDVLINGTRPEVAAPSTTPGQIGWDVPDEYRDRTAEQLLQDAISPFIGELKRDFVAGFRNVVNQWDDYSFRHYCTAIKGWPHTVVDFVETVISQSNQFNLSVPELVMQNMDFGTADWVTIEKGMSRLPQAMAHLIGYRNITFGARVNSIKKDNYGRITLHATGYNGSIHADFDRVILAIPPAALKMIADRPRWSTAKEVAIRSMHFEPLYKMGLRFKTRFWERTHPNASRGGQSTSDLPIRWLVFPSNGIGDEGPGVLLAYAWMTDATTWVPLTPIERRSLAVQCIKRLYQDQWDGGNKIDIDDQLIETSDAVWSASTATGDAMFLPGQFRAHFDIARKAEDNIYFAGEHLSYHHTWISGAANSALNVVRDMLRDSDLRMLTHVPEEPAVTSPVAAAADSGYGHFSYVNAQVFGSLPETIANAPFAFKPNDPFYSGPLSTWHPGETNSGRPYLFPTNLGAPDTQPLGPHIVSMGAAGG